MRLFGQLDLGGLSGAQIRGRTASANLSGATFSGNVIVGTGTPATIASLSPRETFTPGGVNNGGFLQTGFSNNPAFARLVLQELVGSEIRANLHVSDGGSNQAFFLFSWSGNLSVPGTISKGGGTFLIDHPLDPFNKNLQHGFVEGPEYVNIYRGMVNLENGRATVDIDATFGMTPGTFAALNADVMVTSLQNQYGFERLRVDGPADSGVFTIVCEDETSTAAVAWMVTGRRNDPFVRSELDQNTDSEGRFIPEFDKEDA